MRSAPIDVRDRPPYTVDQFRVKERYKPSLESILVSEGEIKSRITCLADEISSEYRGRNEVEVYAICVLKGAMQFFGALIPQLDVNAPISEGVVRSSRYAAGDSEAEQAEVQWLDQGLIDGRDILVIEDIVDEGYTLETILTQLDGYNPTSVDVAVLFDKVARRKTDVDIGFTGFRIPDEFVVGYGLDYDEQYRDVRHLAVLDETAMDS